MNPEELIPGQQAPAEKSIEEPSLEINEPQQTTEVGIQTIDQIKQKLLDTLTIAQQNDIRGHESVIAKASEIRTRATNIAENVAQKNETLKQKEQRASEIDALKAEKVLALKQRLKTVVAWSKNLLRIKDKSATEIQTEIDSMESELEKLTTQAGQLRVELEQLTKEQTELPDPEKMLKEYYAKMETLPLSNEEKREFLRPEVLTELSTEEYTALWRRLNPYFLSHVTRQGFRDHNAMIYHSGGLQEFHFGLTSVLQDQKLLRPPLAVRGGLLARDEASIQEFLEDWALQAEDEEKAKERLNDQLNHSLAKAPKYPDKTAVHFAAQIVSDRFYGGEKRNEVFFLYPSDVLASQYDFAFNGAEKDFTQPQSQTSSNDVFIWPPTLDNPGIPVDAGIVFLPQNTLVDPETGSKYAFEVKIIDGEEKRVMIEDEKLISSFVEWAENLTDESPVIQAYKKNIETSYDYGRHKNDKLRECFDVFRIEIMKLGFDEEIALDITYNLFGSADGISQFQYTGAIGDGNTKKEAALSKLRASGANWKKAPKTITAKEYWEAYFEEHPEQKPKHVIFYDGTPTTAIQEFQTKHNIGQADTSEKEGDLLGFDDRHISDMNRDTRANQGYDELIATAHRIIEEHYRKKEY